MKIFGGEAGPEVGTVRFFLVRKRHFLIFSVLSCGLRALLRMVAVIDYLFDLMLDLFLAD